MPRLKLVYDSDPVPGIPFSIDHTVLVDIECKDMLEGLAIIHERLNAVAMPKVYRSTIDVDVEDFIWNLRANSGLFTTTVSC